MVTTLTAEAPTQLTGLQRLQLRDSLQDLWRDQVRRITLLSLAMYDDLDAAEPTVPADDVADPDRIEADLVEARTHLVRLEEAMRSLDNGYYGHCSGCGALIDFPLLAAEPLTTACGACAVPRVGGARLAAIA